MYIMRAHCGILAPCTYQKHAAKRRKESLSTFGDRWNPGTGPGGHRLNNYEPMSSSNCICTLTMAAPSGSTHVIEASKLPV